jgi:thiopeptide-type bacteriocin biosynthesis protein
MWTSAHFFHQGDLDRLIVKLVGPVISEIERDDPTTEFFFVRYWEGGPHVRLRLSMEPSPTFRNLIARRAGEFFMAFPSEDRLNDPRAFVEFSTAAAQREGIAAASVRYPNDSLQFIGYTFDVHRYGTIKQPVERHFWESSRLALSLLNAGFSMDQRQAVAFTAVILSSVACGFEGPEIGRQIKSRWSAWAFGNSEASDAERLLAEAYEFRRRELMALALDTLNSVYRHSGQSGSPVAEAWFQSISTLYDALEEGGRDRRTIVDTCTHMLMNRLGLSPSREGYVRYLAARATGDIYDDAGRPQDPMS